MARSAEPARAYPGRRRPTYGRAGRNLPRRTADYHLSLNYADGDTPGKQMMLEDADRVLGELGVAEHQAVLVSDNDTGHRHVHLMGNRVAPDKARAHNVWRDRTRMRNIVGRVEKARGYQRVSAGREWGGKEQRKARSKGEFMRLRKQGFEKMPLAD